MKAFTRACHIGSRHIHLTAPRTGRSAKLCIERYLVSPHMLIRSAVVIALELVHAEDKHRQRVRNDITANNRSRSKNLQRFERRCTKN